MFLGKTFCLSFLQLFLVLQNLCLPLFPIKRCDTEGLFPIIDIYIFTFANTRNLHYQLEVCADGLLTARLFNFLGFLNTRAY